MTPSAAPVPLPDPPLGHGALLLRPWRSTEAPVLVEAWADAEVARWTGVPEHRQLADARRWIRGDAHRRAQGLSLDLAVDVGGVVVGEVGLSEIDTTAHTAEIGWWVGGPHRRQGWAARAAALVAAWTVEELCVDVVLARCAAANPASGAVARKAGFSLVDSADGSELWRFPDAGGATLGA